MDSIPLPLILTLLRWALSKVASSAIFGCWLFWLFGVLWCITFCRLFSAKSIFMKIILFQIIHFRISTKFKCKYSLIVKKILFLAIQFTLAVLIQLIQFRFSLHTVKCQNSSILNKSVKCKYSFNVQKTTPFQINQFCISRQFKCKYGLIVKNISTSSYSV